MPPFITLKREHKSLNSSNSLENAFAACMHELHLEFDPVVRTLLRGQSFSQVMPFLCEPSPHASGKDETGRRILLAQRRAFTTQILGGPRQPIDRQVRYYSEALPLASRGSARKVDLNPLG